MWLLAQLEDNKYLMIGIVMHVHSPFLIFALLHPLTFLSSLKQY